MAAPLPPLQTTPVKPQPDSLQRYSLELPINKALRMNIDEVMRPVYVGLMPPTDFMDTLMEPARTPCPKDVSFPSSKGCKSENDMYAPMVSMPSVLLLLKCRTYAPPIVPGVHQPQAVSKHDLLCHRRCTHQLSSAQAGRRRRRATDTLE